MQNAHIKVSKQTFTSFSHDHPKEELAQNVLK